MVRTCVTAAAALFALVMARPTHAYPVEAMARESVIAYDFGGILSPGNRHLPGTAFSGRVAIDTAVSDGSDRPDFGEYSGAVTGIYVTLADGTVAPRRDRLNVIQVLDALGTLGDELDVFVGSADGLYVSLRLYPAGEGFGGGDGIPSLSDTPWLFAFAHVGLGDGVEAGGYITSVNESQTVFPEPAAAGLSVATVVIPLLARRRRRGDGKADRLP
jgi:hypothetical protein